MIQKKSTSRLVLKILAGFIVLLAMIASIALILLNSTFIYRLIIDYYELPYTTGLTRGMLMENYLQIISYFRNPWASELNMTGFTMSRAGRIHFEEVRQIFQSFYIIVIICIISLTIAKMKGRVILPILNIGANLAIFTVIIISTFMAIDFTQTFIFFHLLIFRNDYWLFDPLLDPVILALPEELFLILGIAALVLLFLQILIIKLLYRNQKHKYK